MIVDERIKEAQTIVDRMNQAEGCLITLSLDSSEEGVKEVKERFGEESVCYVNTYYKSGRAMVESCGKVINYLIDQDFATGGVSTYLETVYIDSLNRLVSAKTPFYADS